MDGLVGHVRGIELSTVCVRSEPLTTAPHAPTDDIFGLNLHFTRKVLIRTDGFLYSRIPGARITNAYYNIHTLESRRKMLDVCTLYKMLWGMLKVDLSKIFTIVKSKTSGSSEKISYVGPKTTIRHVSFTCRAGSSYLSLRYGLVPSPPNFFSSGRMVSRKLLLN
ncbi:hypothetical protein Y032_0296g1706 [Ancylostoma ceylanicum]|uniref:Uncharacterized protein n=1 Tax=Ancylostoma ceylanicum TaxID=53326 RepID=A0A016S5T0_9BILA|nr:hypothetical protein Y032_0296g1706 [Ancylostoma ceylanicum]